MRRLLFLILACGAALLAAMPLAAGDLPAPGEFCLKPDLEEALDHYRQIAGQGGWPMVPHGPAMRQGDQGARVGVLRKRLAISDDLKDEGDNADLFDDSLEAGVLKFQARHGLVPDGVVGEKTLGELNQPIATRIAQLAANLNRCQPLPRRLSPRHILVNIADFTLTLYEEGEPALSMPVIVGRTYRQTPVLNGRVSSLVLNPAWEVPHSIATHDLLPKIKKDPGFLRRLGFKVFRGWENGAEIAPESIAWAKLSTGRFPYRLRQEPGPANALGQVKFPFPNPQAIYLHDTPAQELFASETRTFSSGCIRLAQPIALAAYLLKGTPLADENRLREEIAKGKTKSIAIPEPIAIHVVYLTAWVNRDGDIQFRPDVYRRDPAL